ncbi:MAG: acetoin utilization protein AcuC, partial [Pseudomonadota bacterium]
VLQCGADAVEEDPLSRLALSNRSHWSVVTALMGMAPRLLVLGGGGYNPWTVGRLWAGVWATLNGHEIPDALPPEAEQVLRDLSWTRQARGPTPEHLMKTLKDTPRPGAITDELRRDVQRLADRLLAWV